MIYDLIASLMRPVAWWGRLHVEGIESLPREGPLLVVSNHDSQGASPGASASRPTAGSRRQRVRVTFLGSGNGDPRPEEAPAEVATRLLDQIRARVPPTQPRRADGHAWAVPTRTESQS